MPSAIDICNLALSEIGTRSTIASFSEGSAESEQCAIWYDPLRQQLLRAAPWGFARGQGTLSPLGDLAAGTSQYPWPFKYLYPPDALRVRYILPPTPLTGERDNFSWGAPSRANRFLIGNDIDEHLIQRRVVLTVLQNAQAVYIRDVTDVDLFDPSFKLALAAALAFKLIIPLTGNAGMRQEFKQNVNDTVLSARAADGNEAVPTTDHTPDWISARGYGSPYAGSPFGDLGLWYVRWDELNWSA